MAVRLAAMSARMSLSVAVLASFDEVVLAGAVHARVGLAASHHVPLVVAGEHDLRLSVPTLLGVDELLDQLDPAVAVPDLAPDVERVRRT